MSYEDPLRWWGFRLRKPPGVELEPISRLEAMHFFLLVSLLAQLGWYARLILRPATADWGDWILMPLALLLLLPLLGWLPRSWLETTRIAAVLTYARDQGNLRGLDGAFVLGAIAFAVAAVVRHWNAGWDRSLLPLSLLLLTLALAGFGFRLMQPGIDFVQRRKWRVEIPEWLHTRVKTEGVRPGPDPKAGKIYPFRWRDDSYEVGVALPAELIAEMRKLNAEHNGRLYQSHPSAVVLVDREPAEGLGADELQRLVGQLAFPITDVDATRLAIANALLRFVQKNFEYALDIDSTADVPGGPFEEYGRFALETVSDGQGDCECTSILYASLLALFGFDVALLFVRVTDEEKGGEISHCAVGVNAKGLFRVTAEEAELIEGLDYVRHKSEEGEISYLYAETATSSDGRSLGVIPPQWKEQFTVERVLPIVPLSETS